MCCKVIGTLSAVDPREDWNVVSVVVTFSASAHTVGDALGEEVSFLLVRLASLPSTQISKYSTPSTHGTLNSHPHFLPVQPQ